MRLLFEVLEIAARLHQTAKLCFDSFSSSFLHQQSQRRKTNKSKHFHIPHIIETIILFKTLLSVSETRR